MKRQEGSNKKYAYINVHDYRSCSYKAVSAVCILINDKIQKKKNKLKKYIYYIAFPLFFAGIITDICLLCIN